MTSRHICLALSLVSTLAAASSAAARPAPHWRTPIARASDPTATRQRARLDQGLPGRPHQVQRRRRASGGSHPFGDLRRQDLDAGDHRSAMRHCAACAPRRTRRDRALSPLRRAGQVGRRVPGAMRAGRGVLPGNRHPQRRAYPGVRPLSSERSEESRAVGRVRGLFDQPDRLGVQARPNFSDGGYHQPESRWSTKTTRWSTGSRCPPGSISSNATRRGRASRSI